MPLRLSFFSLCYLLTSFICIIIDLSFYYLQDDHTLIYDTGNLCFIFSLFRSDWYQIYLSFQNLVLMFFDFSTSCCCFNSIDHCSNFKVYFYNYLCWGVMVLAYQYLWGWKENLEELVLVLVGKHLLSTSHLTSPRTWTSNFLLFFFLMTVFSIYLIF